LDKIGREFGKKVQLWSGWGDVPKNWGPLEQFQEGDQPHLPWGQEGKKKEQEH
jgi:hypothetical protein